MQRLLIDLFRRNPQRESVKKAGFAGDFPGRDLILPQLEAVYNVTKVLQRAIFRRWAKWRSVGALGFFAVLRLAQLINDGV